MHLNVLAAFLADVTNAAPGQQAPPSPIQMLFGSPITLVILMVIMMYFLMFRPQQQQRARQAELLKNLKPGDKVVTSSGIVGSVITVKDRTVTLRSADAKMEVSKASVTEILAADSPES